MDYLWGAFRGGLEAELLEQLQHRAVLGQHFRNQFLETCVTRKGSQMAHQDRPNALTLIVINHVEIDIEKKGHFPFGKALLWNEEASLKRLHAGAPDRREHVGPVIGTKRTDFDRTAVAKMLSGPIICSFSHGGWLPGPRRKSLQRARMTFWVFVLDLDQAGACASADRLGT